jgi:hypothetical protein
MPLLGIPRFQFVENVAHSGFPKMEGVSSGIIGRQPVQSKDNTEIHYCCDDNYCCSILLPTTSRASFAAIGDQKVEIRSQQ